MPVKRFMGVAKSYFAEISLFLVQHAELVEGVAVTEFVGLDEHVSGQLLVADLVDPLSGELAEFCEGLRETEFGRFAGG